MRVTAFALAAAALLVAAPLAVAQSHVPEPPFWLLLLLVQYVLATYGPCVDQTVDHYTAGGPECAWLSPLP